MSHQVRALLTLLLLTLLLSSSPPISAQDIPSSLGQPNSLLSPGEHIGAAPVHPDEPDDEHFVIDVAPDLDTACTFRNGGPLRFSIQIDRYIGEVNDDGTLRNVATLIANGIVSAKARLLMPAYDVDSNGDPTSQFPDGEPEVDKVFLNDQELNKPLTGLNDEWILNEFEIPIEYLRFPATPGTGGSKPTPVANEIRIEIDTANIDIGEEIWCMAIDWAQVEFTAMAPILLIHGTASGPQTWENGVTAYLDQQRVPYDHRIQLTPNGSIDGNARQLAQAIAQRAKNFGVNKVHLVAHSKGGLDSRRFLSAYYQPTDEGAIKILSLHTISTPHHGTVLSDIAVQHRTLNDPQSEDPDIQSFLDTDWWINKSGQGPRDAALRDQQTAVMRTFNTTNLFPAGIRFYTYGADADVDNDGAITFAEQTPLFDGLNIPGLDPLVLEPAEAATLAYHLLRDVASIRVERHTDFWGLNEWHVIIPNATASAQDNDLVVTDTSSQHTGQHQHFGPRDFNHSSIQNDTTMASILTQIKSDFPLR